MNKFLLGVAVGYIFSDFIDDLVGYSKKQTQDLPKKTETSDDSGQDVESQD